MARLTAASSNEPVFLEKLIELGANINAVCHESDTASGLCYARMHQHTEIIRILLEANAVDNSGYAP